MAGARPIGNPTQIGGWTAFSATNLSSNGSGPKVAPTTSPAQSAANNTPTAQDQLLFAKQAPFISDAIINLATRYATSDIAMQANKAAGQKAMTRRAAHDRLRTALVKHAKNTGRTADAVRVELTAAKKANGVKCNRSNGPKGNDQHTGETTEENSDTDVEDVAGSPAPTPSGLSDADKALFANPDSLFGANLLSLAERYHNVEICNNIGKKARTNKLILGRSGISLRITRALNAQAKATNTTPEQARTTFTQAREQNGIKTRPAAVKKSKVEPAQQAVVATTTATGGADVEMVDISNGDNQNTHTAADLEAANTIFSFFSEPTRENLNASELLWALPQTAAPLAARANHTVHATVGATQEAENAAAILMQMRKADASLAVPADHTGDTTEEEVSDTDMSDAEITQFMADFAAERWRGPNGERLWVGLGERFRMEGMGHRDPTHF